MNLRSAFAAASLLTRFPFLLSLGARRLVCLGIALVALLPAAEASEYPLTRLGIEGLNHGPHSLTLKVTQDGNGYQSIGSATWTGSVANPPTSNSVSANPKLYLELLPEMNYYLHAQSASATSDQWTEVSFDAPEGHQLLVDGVARNHLHQKLLADGKKSWTIRLAREGQAALRPGEHLPPYVGKDYLLDIYLGKAKNNNDAGWIRISKSALMTGAFNRDMVVVRKEYSDVSVYYESEGFQRITRIETDKLKVLFAELPGGQGPGFKATFFDRATLGAVWTQTVEYTFKRGATAKELLVEKTGATSQQANFSYSYSLPGTSTSSTGSTGFSFLVAPDNPDERGTPVHFNAETGYEPATNQNYDCVQGELVQLQLNPGDGSSAYTRSPQGPGKASITHVYPTNGTFNGSFTAVVYNWVANQQTGSCSAVQANYTRNFSITLSGQATWVISEESGWREQVVDIQYSPTGNLPGHLKETVTRRGKRDTTGDGSPDSSVLVDLVEKRYYKKFVYHSSIPLLHLGNKRSHALLTRRDVGTGGDILTTLYAYHEDASKPGSYGKLKSVVDPSGNWKYLTYFDGVSNEIKRRGLIKAIYEPSDNTALSPTTAPLASNSIVTTFSYATMPGSPATEDHSYFVRELASREVKDKGALIGKTVVVTTRENEAGGNTETLDIVKRTVDSYMNGSDKVAVTQRSYHADEATGRAGRAYSVVHQDGTKVSYTYMRGDWTFESSAADPQTGFVENASAGKFWLVEETHGRVDGVNHAPSIVLGLSTRSVSVLDEQFRTVFNAERVYELLGSTTAPSLASWSAYTYHPTRLHLTNVENSNGTTPSNEWTDDWLTARVTETGERTEYTHDPFGRVYKTVKKGATAAASGSAGAGLPTELGFDLQPDVAVTVVFDSLGRAIQRKSTGTGATDVLSSSQVFNVNGTLQSVTAECCSVTNYASVYGSGISLLTTGPSGAQEQRSIGLNGRLEEVEATDPSGASGMLDQVMELEYGYETIGSAANMPYVKEYLGPDGEESPRWRKTTSDWLGNVLRVESSAFPDENDAARTYVVDYQYGASGAGAGRLLQTKPAGAARSFYEYDDTATGLGQLHRTIVDYNGDNESQLGTDSVIEYKTLIEKDGADLWLRSDSLVYAPGQSAGTRASRSRQQLTGLGSLDSDGFTAISREVGVDASGNTATSTAYVDSSRKLIKSIAESSLSENSQLAVSRNGLQIAATASPVSEELATFHYDALRRLTKATDPFGDTILRGYETNSARLADQTVVGKSKVSYEYYSDSDAAGSRRQLKKTTCYTYVPAGPSYTALDSEVENSYYPNGALKSTYGDGVTPSYYSYDTWGQVTSVVQSASQGDANTPGVHYKYDTASGLLKSKYRSLLDLAHAENGEQYSYYANGAVQSYTNARGQEQTYTYAAQGQVASMASPEGSFTYGYDRLGRVTSQTEPVTGARSYTYRLHSETKAPMELDAVEYTGSYYGAAARKLKPLYDEAGRNVGVQVRDASDAIVYESKGTLDGMGRLGKVTAKAGLMGARDFDFAYGADHPHAASEIASPLTADPAQRFKRQFARDSYGRLLATSAGVVATSGANLLNFSDGKIAAQATPQAHYYYVRDHLDRISVEEKRGAVFDAYARDGGYQGLQTTFAYNAKSEVVSAQTGFLTQATYGSGYDAGTLLPGRSVAYETDGYGNLQRRRVAETTVPSALPSSDVGRAWTHNEYNQISQQTDAGKVPVTGTASASASVWVAGQSEQSSGVAGRVGTYFHRSIPYANEGAPVFEQEIGIIAQTGSGSALAAAYDFRSAFVPEEEVAPLYDADGNLLYDGEWRYEWDALGRLVRVRRSLSAVVAGANFQSHAYAYDEMGRRVESVPEAGSYEGRTRYLYWGMNMVAEIGVSLDGSGAVTAATLKKAHFWRPDSLGHAGALLGTAVDPGHGTPSQRRFVLVGNDGRGNVTTWTDGSSGALLGSRDYGPFGELWHEKWEEGWAEDAFSETGFGFSTEYHDASGLVYYGFRYYSPALGRFISRDPMGEVAGPNLYRLAGGDPVNKRDLWGLCEQDFWSGQGSSGDFWGSGWDSWGSGSNGSTGSPGVDVVHDLGEFDVYQDPCDPRNPNRPYYCDYAIESAIDAANESMRQPGQPDLATGEPGEGWGSAGTPGGTMPTPPTPPNDNELPPCSEFFKDGVVNLTAQSFIMDQKITNPLRHGIKASPVPGGGWNLEPTEDLLGDGRDFLDSPADGNIDTYRGHNSLTVYTNEGYSEHFGDYGLSTRISKRTGAVVSTDRADAGRHWASAWGNGSEVLFNMTSSAGEPFDAALTNVVAPIYIRAGLTVDISKGTVRGTIMHTKFPSFQVFVNGKNIYNSEEGKPFDISKLRERAAIDLKLCDPSK